MPLKKCNYFVNGKELIMNNTYSLRDIIYDSVYSLLCQKRITTDNLSEVIHEQFKNFSHFYEAEVVDEEEILRTILLNYGVFEGHSSVLEDNRNHIEWLANERATIKWNFWNRYKKYLSKDKEERLPESVISEIDNTSEEILKRLESPRREGAWDRRGMVVGNVQSGKTSNYIGLITKAVDAGYKIIIVLAGLNNDLRSQTQKRIDRGFIGRDTQKKESYDQTSSRIGVGLFTEFPNLPIHAVTSADATGDFKKTSHKNVTIIPGGDPIVAVVKKNVTPLRNLYNWFSGENVSGRISNVPLLLIDDEADNASIDTNADKKIGETEVDPDLEEQDPTKINGYIRQILNCFSQSAYVGYTATPFANIFIYPSDINNICEKYGEDLYPRSFIVNLHAPSNYIGPDKVFGLYKDKIANIQEVKPLPLIRIADDYQSVIPDKHKKDLKVTSLPDSLSKAIYSFIIAGAIRNIRGQGKKHHSMLVHVTRFVDVQMQLVELLKSVRKEIVNQLDFKTGPQYETLINVIKDLWENDFLPTTNSVIKSLKDPLIRDCTWEEIEPKLYEIASKIEIKAVNGKAADGGLNYDDYPDGYFVIAVGGDKLSRGLTLSGLTVSYYARLSQAYDTLLQMGRWFGYRDGYADVCRLYTSSKLNEWYRHIAVANEELRNELDDMAELGATPESYGLKVRTHPDGMLITALNKMRNSENRQVTFAGKLAQTTRFYKENNCNQRNIHFVKEWIAKLGTPELPNIQTRNNYLWKDIAPELVLEFLKNISVHPTCSNASPKILSDYISSQNEDGELISWSVALVSSKQGTHFSYGNGIEIGLSWRTDDVSNRRSENDTIYLIRNNLITESDQDVDLTQKQKDEALRRTIDKWTPERTNKLPKAPSPMYIRQCREKTNGLLLIYTFESGLLDEKGEKGKVYPDKYLGYAISFPASDTAKPIEYKVDEVYLRNATDE